MKLLRIINKSIKDAFKSILRNFSLSIASISCTAVTLVLVSVAILFSYNINNITEQVKDVLTIVIFVDSKATDDEIQSVKDKLLSIENVDSEKVKFISKDQMKNDLSSKDDDMKAIIDILGDENPIPSSFVVTVKDIKKLTETANTIKTIEKVEDIKYGENVVNEIISVFDFISKACIVTVIALIVVTAFLIDNTIKVTIFSRRNEIGIMRLVGTSNTVIKMPFLVEGFILGLIGSILPVLLTIYGYMFLYDYVGGKFFINLMILVKPDIIVYKTSLVLLIVGGVVGIFGSLRAVRRYLKI